MKRVVLLISIICWQLMVASILSQERIILLNEGNWQADNGRITYFEDGKVVSNQWFRDKNRYKLGDTPNDILQINDNLIAIAINWSNIVQFITPEGKAVAATEDIPNNRRLATDGRYLYVTSYGHECKTIHGMRYFTRGYVAKIDIATYQVIDAVEVGYEPEGIAYYKGKLFVANTGGYAFQEDHSYESTVSIIDAETMHLVKNIDTGVINLYGEMSQSGQYLCINSPGDYYDVEASSVIFDCELALDGALNSFQVLPYAATYNTTTKDGKFFAIGARFSYYTNQYKFNYLILDPKEIILSLGTSGIEEDALPGDMISTLKRMTSPYAIYVNPYTGYIYATDAGSYAAGGALYQFSSDGKLLGSYKVYINPGHLLALPPDGCFATTKSKANVSASQPKILYHLNGERVDRAEKHTITIERRGDGSTVKRLKR